jgi:hypothetical protein
MPIYAAAILCEILFTVPKVTYTISLYAECDMLTQCNLFGPGVNIELFA